MNQENIELVNPVLTYLQGSWIHYQDYDTKHRVHLLYNHLGGQLETIPIHTVPLL